MAVKAASVLQSWSSRIREMWEILVESCVGHWVTAAGRPVTAGHEPSDYGWWSSLQLSHHVVVSDTSHDFSLYFHLLQGLVLRDCWGAAAQVLYTEPQDENDQKPGVLSVKVWLYFLQKDIFVHKEAVLISRCSPGFTLVPEWALRFGCCTTKRPCRGALAIKLAKPLKNDAKCIRSFWWYALGVKLVRSVMGSSAILSKSIDSGHAAVVETRPPTGCHWHVHLDTSFPELAMELYFFHLFAYRCNLCKYFDARVFFFKHIICECIWFFMITVSNCHYIP